MGRSREAAVSRAEQRSDERGESGCSEKFFFANAPCFWGAAVSRYLHAYLERDYRAFATFAVKK